MTITNNES